MGLILPQTVKIKSHNFTRKYYESKNYIVGKIGEEFKVNVLDLQISSTCKVMVICDFCGKEYEIEYRKFLLQKEGGTACINCRYNKTEETNFKRYGVKCSLRNENILNKSKAKNLEKYGVEYPFQNDEILQKTVDTQIKKYGTFGRKINTSKQQIYINNIYNGTLNYRIGNYCVDILLENNIICEYDGLGHNMLVKLGKLTEKEFTEKEKARSIYLRESGYKEFHIIGDKKDKLPDDTFLLSLKNDALNELIDNYKKYYSYNLKTHEIITF